MTAVPPVHVAPLAKIPDLSAEYDRGVMTSALRIAADHRTHIDRLCPYLPGESYAGAGGVPQNFVSRFPQGLMGAPPDQPDAE